MYAKRIGFVLAAALLVSIRVEARTVTAVWDANTDELTAGYRLHWDNQPNGGGDGYAFSVDVGNATSHEVDLIPGSTYYFVVTAYDAGGLDGPPSNEAFVTLPNEPPVLTNPGAQTSAWNANVSLQLVANDPDGDPLTYLATNLPPSLRIDPSSGTISGVVTAAVGMFTVTVTASDGAAQHQESFEWRITPVDVGVRPLGF
jgi:hypothetical protein